MRISWATLVQRSFNAIGSQSGEPSYDLDTMARPLPTLPRGPKRDEVREIDRIVLSCPKVSPEYQFRAFLALVKPQFKKAVVHRSGKQTWPRSARKVVVESIEKFATSRSRAPLVSIQRDAVDLLAIEFDPRDARRARSISLEISQRLPKLWFVFDGRLLHAGRFYRQQGRYRLVPVSMRVPRLPRELFLTMAGAADAPDPADPAGDDPDE